MKKMKLLYEVPRTEVLEMDYAEPVCTTVSGGLKSFTVDSYTADWDEDE